MDRFIHEFRHRRLSLLDDGIDVLPSSELADEPVLGRDPYPVQDLAKAQPRGGARSSAATHHEAYRSKASRASDTIGFCGGQRELGGRKPTAVYLARPQIISCFIDYFVVLVTVASVYFGYRLVSHTSVSTALLDPGTSPADTASPSNDSVGGDAFMSSAGEGLADLSLPELWSHQLSLHTSWLHKLGLSDLSVLELALYGSIGLVGFSVLYFVYKLMHRLFGIPSLGERFVRRRNAA